MNNVSANIMMPLEALTEIKEVDNTLNVCFLKQLNLGLLNMVSGKTLMYSIPV